MMIGLGDQPCVSFNRADLIAAGFGAYGVDALAATMPPNFNSNACIPDIIALPASYIATHTIQPAGAVSGPAPMAPVPASNIALVPNPPIVVGNSGSPISPTPAPVVLTPGPSYTVAPPPPTPSAFPSSPAPVPSAPVPQAPVPQAPIASTSGQSVATGSVPLSSGIPDTIFGINSTYVLIGGAALLLLLMGKK